MGELPKDTIYDILSRIPVKSLARFECVCKQWCKYINDPYLANIHVKQESTPIILSQRLAGITLYSTVLSFLHVMEGTNALKVKKESSSRIPGLHQFQGSCNGLIFSSCDYLNGMTFVVINPLRKECYELPPIDIRSVFHTVGLGFDDSTNTFKMVSVFIREPHTNIDELRENQCTMVHVLGTDLWREIPQVPFYPIIGEAVFSHGCLHWITAIMRLRSLQTKENKVVLFDVKKEEFGLIDPPKQKGDRSTYHKLVDLNGEVGFVYNNVNIGIEVWILKQKEWVIHCQFDQKWPLSKGRITVLDSWNQDGDILMTSNYSNQQWYVYSLKSGNLHKANIVGWEDGCEWPDIRMYQSNLLSIHSVNTNSYSIKKQ